MEYVPYSDLTGRPHVIADGSARRSTVLTLSHWPRSGTPWPLKADLSTQIAYRYLDAPDHHVGPDAQAVSNDHLDLDGFLSVFVLSADEALVRRHREAIVEAARCGDFGTTTSTAGRRLAAAIGAATDEATSPFDPSVFALDRPQQVAALYRLLLDAVPSWLGDLGAPAVEALWRDDEEAFLAAEDAFTTGRVTIDEHPDVDVAVVRLDPTLRLGSTFRSTIQGWGPLHPVAVHNRTDRLRLVYVSGDRAGLLYRFESWVQLMSREAMPRVDLIPLAAALGPSWTWAFPRNPNPPVPWLQTTDPAAGPPAGEVVERVLAYLRAAPRPEPDVYDPRPYGPGVDLVSP